MSCCIVVRSCHQKIVANHLRVHATRSLSLKPVPQSQLVWRADENDPLKHNRNHEGLFYELPSSEEQMMNIYGFKSPYFQPEVAEMYKNLRITPLMIRAPALTAMDYLKSAKSSLPNLRMLFYGDIGQGKTHTLVHLIHYLHCAQDYVIFNIRNMRTLLSRPKDYEESMSRPGRINTPLDSAVLLQQFKMQNAHLLDKLQENLVCSETYKWSSREITSAGEPLLNVVDHGVNRVIHSSDCLAVLLKELALASDSGKIKLAVVVDNLKYLFQEQAARSLRHKDMKHVMVDEMTVAIAVKRIITGKQRNCFVLGTCHDDRSKIQNLTPREILGIDGWQAFNPFLPIHVPKYSRQEFESCMNFYQDIGWLTRPEANTQEARDDVRLVSALNPAEVWRICSSL